MSSASTLEQIFLTAQPSDCTNGTSSTLQGNVMSQDLMLLSFIIVAD